MWKHSRDGNYSTKIAYKLLTEDFLGSQQFQQERKVWTTIWKAHVPLRIINFVWKLLHDSLPTKATLHNRGINNDETCPLCNAEEETPTHLFLLRSFSKACQFGSDLGLHTSEITNVSAQSWLKDYFSSCLNNEDQSLVILQSMFIVLWLIWNHRNRVLHQGLNPNPLEVN